MPTSFANIMLFADASRAQHKGDRFRVGIPHEQADHDDTAKRRRFAFHPEFKVGGSGWCGAKSHNWMPLCMVAAVAWLDSWHGWVKL